MVHLIAIGTYVQAHIVGILLAIVASYVVGFLWHGPLFGKQWLALNNIKAPAKEEMKFSMMLPGLSANFVMIFVQSAVLGRAFQLVSLANIGEALIIATIIWLPFSALLLVNIYAWGGKPVKLMVLDSGHALVSMWTIAAVLYATL
ncbi:MAG: DUF1761 domain-containing protein [Candidatus Peregrinibacteria bacterium]|nr:DUF1761 domain-containing protein [Candidatus Peregrinibacteria bacterium]